MSEKFSATLRIGDLNDFIAPSQACIVSVKGLAKSAPASKFGSPEVSVDPRKLVKAVEPVKISLKDCLACSGCITSAETVMLEKQSLDVFISNIDKGKTVIVSVSSQSRASLAVHFGLTPLQVLRKLTTLFKSMGVKAVFDTSCSRDITLIESCNEFLRRYKQNKSSGEDSLPMLASSCPVEAVFDTSCSRDITLIESCNEFLRRYKQNKSSGEDSLPMLASSCPGWICYAEKTLGSFILPYISTVKSPQQTMGAVVKHHLAELMDLRVDDMYHVSVMPCYDKKLEAVRDDFAFQLDSPHDADEAITLTEVDSVLTSGEVLDLIQLKGVDFKDLEESSLDTLMTNVDQDGNLYGVCGSSGGYAETIFRYAAKELFDIDIEGPLDFKIIRNADFQEVTLDVEGKTGLKFALCYGFRNLQNIVRKIKSGKCDYDFVEVMACPSGCLNGGGQIKPQPGQTAKDLIQALETIYMEKVRVSDPFKNPRVRQLYDEWLERPGSKKAKKYMHTEYHPIVKSIASELHNW